MQQQKKLLSSSKCKYLKVNILDHIKFLILKGMRPTYLNPREEIV
uniref:Uncharacterized protein n=1 Tax=Rhizophora mucronata TaxID=61149 RepID=A0A2P2M8A3_RHIMU